MRVSHVSTRSGPSGGGFTILELLLTIVLLSVFSALAIPAYFSQPNVTLESASVLLAQDLRAAQNRSAYLAESSQFRFLDHGDGYSVHNPLGARVQNPATSLPFVRSYSEDGVFDGVEITSVRCGGDRTIVYDENGRATEGAEITLSFEGATRTVRLQRGSGSVTIVGSTSGWIDHGY